MATNSRTRRPAIHHSLSEHIAARQFACELLVGTPGLMKRIACAARAPLQEVTGPAVDAIESLILSGDDPLENVGLVVDAVARELRPRGPTIDPSMLESHGGTVHPMDILTAGFYDAPVVTGAGADGDDVPLEQPAPAQAAIEAAAAIAKLLDRGQDHRKSDHRQKEKAAAARDAGQLWFCGLDWRLPPSNDDDDGLDGDGLAPQGA